MTTIEIFELATPSRKGGEIKTTARAPRTLRSPDRPDEADNAHAASALCEYDSQRKFPDNFQHIIIIMQLGTAVPKIFNEYDPFF